MCFGSRSGRVCVRIDGARHGEDPRLLPFIINCCILFHLGSSIFTMYGSLLRVRGLESLAAGDHGNCGAGSELRHFSFKSVIFIIMVYSVLCVVYLKVEEGRGGGGHVPEHKSLWPRLPVYFACVAISGFGFRGATRKATGVPDLQENAPPQDPTVGL